MNVSAAAVAVEKPFVAAMLAFVGGDVAGDVYGELWQVFGALGCNELCVVAAIVIAAAVVVVIAVAVLIAAVVVEPVTKVPAAIAVAAAVNYEQNVVAVVLYDGLWTSMSVGPSAIERRRTSANKKGEKKVVISIVICIICQTIVNKIINLYKDYEFIQFENLHLQHVKEKNMEWLSLNPS